ncbi:MAG: cystathionine beta-synthase [Rhodothermales bacterium]|nr:cystathionine beta-synthase [Rhodothermales bacterium]MBO6779844.1 cystathionine beta-synthase [Rhodothermales bacterium]
MWSENILGTIGNTPLVKLNSLVRQFPCTVLAKVEFFNPGASVKDRIGIAMVEAAERDGRLKPGGTIIEGTSGNTGAGLALAAIAKGYHCIFTTTDKQSQEKIDVLRALGAEVIVCPTAVAPEDPRSYYQVARRLEKETPNSVYLNQYDNPANAEAHYRTTGPELWQQTEGRITHYVAGAGTGGTISGTGRFLKEQNPEVKVIGVDPYGSVYYKYFNTREFDEKEIYPYITEGVGEDILAENMDFDLVDDYVRVTDRDSMIFTRRLAREEGLFVGQSCGMAMAGALQWLESHRNELTADDVVVVVLPDSGFRYLSKTYNDQWMRNHGFLSDRPEWTVAEIEATRRGQPSVVSVASEDSIGRAIELMASKGISQMPVIDDDEVVGSLSESVILNTLIEDPASRDKPVGDVMAAAIPVVPPSLHLEHLSAYLEQEPGAVLVQAEDGGFRIITKSDLIRALSQGKKNAAVEA